MSLSDLLECPGVFNEEQWKGKITALSSAFVEQRGCVRNLGDVFPRDYTDAHQVVLSNYFVVIHS